MANLPDTARAARRRLGTAPDVDFKTQNQVAWADGRPVNRIVALPKNVGDTISGRRGIEIMADIARAYPNKQVTVAVLTPSNDKWTPTDFFTAADVGDEGGDHLEEMLETTDIYWASGAAYDVDNPVALITFFLVDPPPRAGGASDVNDCMWKAIYGQFGGRIEGASWLMWPASFKTQLGVPRSEPVPATAAAKVDAALPDWAALEIYGDASYVSPKLSTASHVCRIELRAGHYRKGLRPVGREKSGRPCVTNKPFRIQNGNQLYTLEGTPAETLTAEEVDSHRLRPGDSPYVLWKVTAHETVEGLSEQLRGAVAGITNKASGGKIPPGFVVTGFRSWQDCSRAIFAARCPMLKAPAPMTSPAEAKWIRTAIRGGIIHAERGFKGYAQQFDAVSFYPSLLDSPGLSLPLGAGTFAELETVADQPAYGLYRVASVKVATRFRPFVKTSGFMTHFEIKLVRTLGGKVELVRDGQANALTWVPGDLVEARRVFGGFTEALFPLKQKGVPGAKLILNACWGALIAQRKHYAAPSEERPPKFETEDGTFKVRSSGDSLLFEFAPKLVGEFGANFVGEYPRFGPFLTGYGRMRFGAMVAHVADRVVWAHTDGFIVKGEEPIPAALARHIGEGLGNIRRERVGVIEVINCNSKAWE